MSTPVEQIKERLGIADVVGSYLKLERAGSSLKAKCPFHNEKTPSFFVSPARGSYYCFGCNKGGDIFSFVQEFEGLDFVGALRVLAQRAGVELKRIDPKVRSQYARLYLCLEKATRFFEETFARSAEAQAYLEQRGLKPETIAAWRLGFAQNDWRLLFEHLLKEGFKPEEMERVGLIKRKTSGPLPSPPARGEVPSPRGGVVGANKGEIREGVAGATTPQSPPYYHSQGSPSLERRDGGEVRFYDAFRGRIIFPIRDSAGRVVAFSARVLPSLDDGKTGKYINSPETILFSKSEVLYGFDKAKLAVRQKDAAILVEGQMDLLMAHQAGYENAVASSGTALTEHQLERLKRLSENLLIAFDSDSAGVKASERAIRLALALGMNVRVIALKEKDPADLIAKNPDEWKATVAGAKHILDFLLDEILSSSVSRREKALQIEKKLLPLLRMLPSKVEQSHFVQTIAERSRLREDALWDTLKKLPAAPFGTREPDAPRASDSRSQVHTVLRRVVGLLFAAQAARRVDAAERIEKRLREIIGADEFSNRLEQYCAEKDSLLAEVELFYGVDGAPPREEEELLRHLEEDAMSVALTKAMDALARAERGGDKVTLPALLAECKRLSDRLSVLKSARFLQ